MFFRDVLRRWRERDGEAIGKTVRVLVPCEAPESLLAELAADSEDFADVAAVLKVDLQAVVTVLRSAAPPRDAADLVVALAARTVDATPVVATPRQAATPLGGWGEGGWGRWTRVRGGARVHPEALERSSAAVERGGTAGDRTGTNAVRAAMAAS